MRLMDLLFGRRVQKMVCAPVASVYVDEQGFVRGLVIKEPAGVYTALAPLGERNVVESVHATRRAAERACRKRLKS